MASDATRDLMLRLRHRMTGEGYHLLKEVRFDRVSDTAYLGGRTRRADAIAVGIARRTEHRIHGFEVKVSRADWQQELRDPTKAADASRYCHYWSLVVSDPAIVRDDLPEGWGLLAPRGRHLVQMVKPKLYEPDVDHRFIASLIQSSSTQHGYCAGWARIMGYARGAEDERKRQERFYRGRVSA